MWAQDVLKAAMGLVPRPSFYNMRGYTQTFEKPSHKMARGVLSGTTDYLILTPKVIPAEHLGGDFEFLRKLYFFGFMRTFHVSSPAEFAVYRRDYLQTLLVDYRQRFRKYRTVFNPNFLESFSFVDNGIGMSYDWFQEAGLKFE